MSEREDDWTAIPRNYLPGCAFRHRHADGRYCTEVHVDGTPEWHFENDDAETRMARCERPHRRDR